MSFRGPRAPKGWRRLLFGEIIKRGDKVAAYNKPKWIRADGIGNRYLPSYAAGGDDEYGDHVHIRRKR